jgi:hypothetical protein
MFEVLPDAPAAGIHRPSGLVPGASGRAGGWYARRGIVARLTGLAAAEDWGLVPVHLALLCACNGNAGKETRGR